VLGQQRQLVLAVSFALGGNIKLNMVASAGQLKAVVAKLLHLGRHFLEGTVCPLTGENSFLACHC
jgi:hypothetical protein